MRFRFRFHTAGALAAALSSAASAILFGLPAIAQTVHHPEPAHFSCPHDQKVWVNTRSGVYHLAGERYYGSTKEGNYMCEKAAQLEGDRETRNGQ